MEHEDEKPLVREAINGIISKEFDGENPEAVFILSGGIKENPANHLFESLAFSDTDSSGAITGGKARVIAASQIAKSFPEISLVTTSHEEGDGPSHASVMAQELVKRGVDASSIILEEESFSTMSEIIEMLKMIQVNQWERVGIITNEYHIPRVRKMFEHFLNIVDDQALAELYKETIARTRIEMIPAETILCQVSGHFKYLIEKVEATDEYKKRLALEQQGIEAIENDRYKFRLK